MGEIRIRLLVDEVVDGSVYPAGAEITTTAEAAARLLNAKAAEIVRDGAPQAETADSKVTKKK